MGGVVMGSSMTEVVEGQRWLAVTVNTSCNLSCPMCYMGNPKGRNQTMSSEMVERLIRKAKRENWNGVAIVGTEPLLDEKSVHVVNTFARSVRTHVMTNGLSLERFGDKIHLVKRLDVSLDGGPRTYSRGGLFPSIKKGLSKWRHGNPNGEVCVVNTLFRENIGNVGDMLEGSSLLGVDQTFFSAYVRTLGGGEGVTPLRTKEIVSALLPFVKGKWKLMIDPYHALFEWCGWRKLKRDVSVLPRRNRLIIDFDPGERIRRVDVNGVERHPFIALHPGLK